jgi:phage baseplate assembly protein W
MVILIYVLKSQTLKNVKLLERDINALPLSQVLQSIIHVRIGNMAIKLNILKPAIDVENSIKLGYLYKDVMFDLTPSFTNNVELYKDNEQSDLKAIYNAAAVINSIKNILTTSPGEKLLNPLFGVDLRDYLFEPVTETRAFFIGTDLYDGLTIQEPRITIERIDIVAVPDESQYEISLNITIPSLNINNVTLRGVLNNDGYTFI